MWQGWATTHPPLGSGREGDESLVCVTDYDPQRGIATYAWVTCYQSMKCTNKIMYLNNSVYSTYGAREKRVKATGIIIFKEGKKIIVIYNTEQLHVSEFAYLTNKSIFN